MKKLSVIVPFRCENEESIFLLERLEDLCQQFPLHQDIEFMVVDSGSAFEFSERCKEICTTNNIKYIFENTRGQVFSLSHCRDVGVMHAEGLAITFLDVDLRFSPSFWDRLLILIKTWGVSAYKKSFFAVPCVYLTQEGTRLFNILANDEDKYQEFYLEYLQGITDNVESFAACSSVMIVDRLHYLSIGGHNSEFSGHGYEDFELYNRLLSEEKIIPEADNYLYDSKSWNTSTYNGFRSQFSLIARPALMVNLMVYHLWHPRPKSSSFYEPKKLSENRKRIFSAFEKFKKDSTHPAPLIGTDSLYENVLYFGNLDDNPFRCLRSIFPLIGKPLCLNEFDLVDKSTLIVTDNIIELIQSNNIDLFFFTNPYGNECRLALYHWCREHDFPYLCFERGALPDSWFFDTNGCNADSISYQAVDYNKEINNEELEKTEKYIYNSLNVFQPLEIQGDRIGGEALLERLKIQGKRVLFVPLQRPSDTVIKYYLGELYSFDEFIEKIDELAGELKKLGWIVLAKKHPLETVYPDFKNVQYAPDDTNFLDLLEAAHSIALINSGVGVYSMMMKKPCYTFGKAFYSVEGVNCPVARSDYADNQAIVNLALKINKGFNFNYLNMIKFINFLAFQFYSFGMPIVKQRVEADNSLRTITTGINFYRIVFNGQLLRSYNSEKRRSISRNAPLFEKYGLDIYNKRKNKETPVIKPLIANTTTIQSERSKNSQGVKKGVDKSKIQKKWGKLRYKPYYFFHDSRIGLIRPFRHFFRK